MCTSALSASLQIVIKYGPFFRIVLMSVQISGSSSATRTRQGSAICSPPSIGTARFRLCSPCSKCKNCVRLALARKAHRSAIAFPELAQRQRRPSEWARTRLNDMSVLDRLLGPDTSFQQRFFFLAKRFVAGETAARAMDAIEHINTLGMSATLDFLGEDVTARDEAL